MIDQTGVFLTPIDRPDVGLPSLYPYHQYMQNWVRTQLCFRFLNVLVAALNRKSFSAHPRLAGADGRLRAIGDLQLVIDIGDMIAHSFKAD